MILLDHFLPSISFTSRACNYCLWQFFTVFTLLLSSHDAYLLTYLLRFSTYPKEDKKVMEFQGEKRKNCKLVWKKMAFGFTNSQFQKKYFFFQNSEFTCTGHVQFHLVRSPVLYGFFAFFFAKNRFSKNPFFYVFSKIHVF